MRCWTLSESKSTDPHYDQSKNDTLLLFLSGYSCLWFFLEPMVYRADNYGFLYRLLETIKQTTDAEDPENSEANKVSVVLCVT